MRNAIKFLAILLALAAFPAAADIYIEQSTRHSGAGASGDDQSGVSKMWMSDSAIRIEEADGKMAHITDLSLSRMITLDLAAGEYFSFPLSQVRSDLERASARLKRSMKVSWRAVPFESRRSISGYDCYGISFLGSGTMQRGPGATTSVSIKIEFWLSEEPGLSMAHFLRVMDSIGIGANPFVGDQVLMELRNLSGFPILTKTTIDMESVHDEIEQQVMKIERIDDLPPDFYSVPAGFREAEAPTIGK